MGTTDNCTSVRTLGPEVRNSASTRRISAALCSLAVVIVACFLPACLLGVDLNGREPVVVVDDGGVSGDVGSEPAVDGFTADGSSGDTSSDAVDGHSDAGRPEFNLCGGLGELLFDGQASRPGSTCGVFGDGILVCNGRDAVRCVFATEPNECGGAGELPAELGSTCGCAGIIVCSEDGGVECADTVQRNSCGGCESLQGRPGFYCERDLREGRYVCQTFDELICVAGAGNACGGDDALRLVVAGQSEPGEFLDGVFPGDACSSDCGPGRYVCDGIDGIRCQPDRPCNRCGGTRSLAGAPGGVCGACGQGRWECAGVDAVTCTGAVTPNVCGGCDPLSSVPGEECSSEGDGLGDGSTGVLLCRDGQVTCSALSVVQGQDAGISELNDCGGTRPLLVPAGLPGAGEPAELGADCGTCGRGELVCDGSDAVRCTVSEALQRNVCDGCATITGRPNTPCGTCGTGRLVCDGTERLRCSGDLGEESGRNTCGGCGTLPGVAGGSCGSCLLWECRGTRLECSPTTEGPGCNGLEVCDDLNCEAQNRGCAETDGIEAAACGGCLSGYLNDQDEGDESCRPVRTCADLDCDNAGQTCEEASMEPAADARCVGIDCGSPPDVANAGVIELSGTAAGSVAVYACDSAYESAGGSDVSVCEASGWESVTLTCVLRECPVVDVPDSSTSITTAIGPNGRSVGSTVSLTCDSGFAIDGTGAAAASRTCGSDGLWMGGLPVCLRRACDALPAAPGTVVGAPSFTHPEGYGTPVSTTSAEYFCAAGSRVGGSPSGETSSRATCNDSGDWAEWSGLCSPVDCGLPPTAPGSSFSTLTSSDTRLGGTATFTCTAGYSVDGSNDGAKSYVATCTDGVGWVFPADRVCDPFVCPELSEPTASGGSAATVSYEPNTRGINSVATYMRQTGYRLNPGTGDTVRTCLATGQWSGTEPTYTRMSCEPIVGSAGLSVSYSDPNRWVDSTATPSCWPGLSPSTGAQTCTESSPDSVEWRVDAAAAPAPSCTNIDECAVGSPCNEDGANAVGTCVDRIPSSASGTRFECGCSELTGWEGTVVVNASATCDGICGDGLTRGTEICDDGVWNDLPWNGLPNPAVPHPRYGLDCEGVECDCVGPNAAASRSCTDSGPRSICLEQGIPTADIAAGNCRQSNPTTPSRCSDGIDNDDDGRADCADPGCSGIGNCPNWNEPGCNHDYFLGAAQGSPVDNYTLSNDPAVSPDRFNLGSGSEEDVSLLWQAPHAGSWVFETCSGTRTFDTVVGVYSANTCSSASAPDVAENDDADPSKSTRLGCSVVEVEAEQSEPLTIVVSAFGGDVGGTFPLNIYPSEDNSCGNGIIDAPRGMGVSANNRRVPDSRITASSFYISMDDREHAPETGRLYQTSTASNWGPATLDLNQWWQVDFQAPVTIGAVATQGRAGNTCGGDGCGQHVTEYRVQWSNDGEEFTTVINLRAGSYDPDDPTLFEGNVDQDTVRYNHFEPVEARYWRIRPTAWNGWMTMRAEFFAAVEECDDGDLVPDDACSNSCVLDQTALCLSTPVVLDRFTGEDMSDLDGGSATTSLCPAGQYAAGLYGRAGGDLERLGIRCATPSFTYEPTTQTSMFGRGSVSSAAAQGGLGGSAFTSDCPTGTFMTGIRGRFADRTDQIQPICQAYAYDGAPGDSSLVRTGAESFATAAGGNGGSAKTFRCPGNQVVSGLVMRTASLVDNVRVVCADIGPACSDSTVAVFDVTAIRSAVGPNADQGTFTRDAIVEGCDTVTSVFARVAFYQGVHTYSEDVNVHLRNMTTGQQIQLWMDEFGDADWSSRTVTKAESATGNGTWRLTISDDANSDGGTLDHVFVRFTCE